MKRSIFDEQTSKALKSWHKSALKKKGDGTGTKPHHPTTQTLGGSHGEEAHNSPGHAHGGVEMGSTGPGETANITASVDIPGDQQDNNNRSSYNKSSGTPDLLTGM